MIGDTKYDNDEGHLSDSDILVARYDDTKGTFATPQHADLENNERDNDDSFSTKEEYIQTSQAIEAVYVLLNFVNRKIFTILMF